MAIESLSILVLERLSMAIERLSVAIESGL